MQAQTNETWYTAADAGPNFLTGEPWHTRGSLHFDTGYRANVSFGYSLAPSWNVDLETGVARNSGFNPEGHIVVIYKPTPGYELGTVWHVQQEVNLFQVPVLINAVYRPAWRSKIKPFFGLGFGCTVGELEANNRYPFLSNERHWDAAAAGQAMVGLEWPVTSGLAVDLSYRALLTTGYDFGVLQTYFPVNSGLGVNQSVSAGVRFKF